MLSVARKSNTVSYKDYFNNNIIQEGGDHFGKDDSSILFSAGCTSSEQ